MATFADLLTPSSKKAFDAIIAEEEERKQKEKQEYENSQRQKYISRGFKTFESLIEYLKTTGRRVYFDFCSDYGIYIQWSEQNQKIKHQVYENNDIDITIGYASLYYTEEEFLDKFKNKASGEPRINKFGYIDDFIRDENHLLNMYNTDDIFIRYL